MPQLNVYVPQELEKKIKAVAKKNKVSLSSWLTTLIRKEIEGTEWPKDFFEKTSGQWRGNFPDIESLKAEDVKL